MVIERINKLECSFDKMFSASLLFVVEMGRRETRSMEARKPGG